MHSIRCSLQKSLLLNFSRWANIEPLDISGETLLQIANDFTVRQVTYYKGKNTWNKNAIRRIIENEHYCGDMFSKGTTELVLKAPKTKTSVRKVFLPKTVALMLAERKKQIDELKELFGEEYSDYTRR